MNPTHGWLRYSPELLEYIPPRYKENLDTWCTIEEKTVCDAGGTWSALCNRAFENYERMVESLTRHRVDERKRRDVFENILPILDSDKPLSYLWDMHKMMRSDLKRQRSPTLKKRILLRNLLLSELLAFMAFRSHQIAELMFVDGASFNPNLKKDDEHGYIYKVDGQWKIFLPVDSFKNSDAAQLRKNRAGIIKDLPSRLFSLLDDYFGFVRPTFIESLKSHEQNHNIAFVGKNGKPLRQEGVYEAIRAITASYLSENSNMGLRVKGVKSFGPHSYRHIVATHLYKHYGTPYEAANRLLVSVKMIEDNYGRFLPSDRHDRSDAHFIPLDEGDEYP